jgi:hypothetical protein
MELMNKLPLRQVNIMFNNGCCATLF